MYSAYHDHNAADWHDRDFDRFRRDEARRRAVLSDRESLSVTPTQTTMTQETAVQSQSTPSAEEILADPMECARVTSRIGNMLTKLSLTERRRVLAALNVLFGE